MLGRVCDCNNASFIVADEGDALTIGMRNASGADCYRVTVQIGDTYQTRTLIDDIGGSVLIRELEDERIEYVYAAAKSNQVYWSGHTAIDLHVSCTDNFKLAHRSRHGGEGDRACGNRCVPLTLWRNVRLELEHFATWKCHRHHVGADRLEAVVREDFLRNCLEPFEAEHARLLNPNVPQAHRPAKTKIADALVSTVVSARDFHRHPRHRAAQMGARAGEVANLQIALKNDTDFYP